MANIRYYGQTELQFKNEQLGHSKPKDGTIGYKGCTITALANLYNNLFGTNLTPHDVNQLFIQHGCYVQDSYGYSIVNWTKIGLALPKLKFVYRDAAYNNDVVKKWIEVDPKVPVIVVVKLSTKVPQHFVLFIGNKQMIDSLDGKVKPTSTYQNLVRSVRFTRA